MFTVTLILISLAMVIFATSINHNDELVVQTLIHQFQPLDDDHKLNDEDKEFINEASIMIRLVIATMYFTLLLLSTYFWYQTVFNYHYTSTIYSSCIFSLSLLFIWGQHYMFTKLNTPESID